LFKINHIQEGETKLNYLELSSQNKEIYAKVDLILGGSLQVLKLNKKLIIEDLNPLPYEDTFASSVLFPYASRIKDGKYTFQQKDYTLKINKKEENNAIHGFVYNKTFEILEQKTSKAEASVKIQFIENNTTQGFPFKYTIQLLYTLTKSSLKLKVFIINNDVKPFPFTLGWHPYFYSSDLFNSFLFFNSDKKICFDERLILNGVNEITLEKGFQIKDSKLDDAYILNNNKISFKTPDYEIGISATSSNNFLTIYTPNKENTLAIEPCTGPSNSFNNKMGLQILQPRKEYQLTWEISLIES